MQEPVLNKCYKDVPGNTEKGLEKYTNKIILETRSTSAAEREGV